MAAKDSIYEEYYGAQQELESKYGDSCIVLMMVGSFYEIYGVDLKSTGLKIGKVEEAHNILGMNMTRKNKALEHSRCNPYMVGFPDYALDEHLGKFLRAGYTVGIYNQHDSDNNRGKKVRRLEHIYTPSTYIDDSIVDSSALMCIEYTEFKSARGARLQKAHLVILNISTGIVQLTEVYSTDVDTGKVDSEVYRIIHSTNPAEIIYAAEAINPHFLRTFDLSGKKIYARPIPDSYRKSSYQEEFLRKIYPGYVESLVDSIGMTMHAHMVPHLIHALQFAYENDKRVVMRIKEPKFIQNTEKLLLNNDSIYQLNLVNAPGSNDTCLYDIICKCKTAMGKRRLRERLLNPISSESILNKRYAQIEKMRAEPLDVYEHHLREIIDLEKKYRKMVQGTLHPYELADAKGSFQSIIDLINLSAGVKPLGNEYIDKYIKWYERYTRTFDFSAMSRSKLTDIRGNFFNSGYQDAIDTINIKVQTCMRVLTQIAEAFSTSIGINEGCKVDSTDREGWYLSMTTKRMQALSEKLSVSINYGDKLHTIRKSDLQITSLKNTCKIRSSLIDSISSDLITVNDSLNACVLQAYNSEISAYVQEYGDIFIKLCDYVGTIDVLYSAACCSIEYGYVRPVIKSNATSFINVVGVRHPIIERIQDNKEYIPNDHILGVNHNGSIVYGLNMCGKSSFLKSIGTNLVLAQAGFWVAAQQWVYAPFTKLLSKMTIKDNMAKGQSTFMVEMLEVKNMLARADSQTLVLSDELCSSTESVSAHSIVAQTLSSLAAKGAKFIFSTHLHDLQDISIVKDEPLIKMYHFKVHIKDSIIVFDRTLVEGGLSELYGIEVAKALGLPNEFIAGALKIRDALTNNHTEILSTKQSRYNKGVYVHSCSKCGATKELHTHHERHQAEADQLTGLIDSRFHKNAKHNLRILCEKCHQLEHAEK